METTKRICRVLPRAAARFAATVLLFVPWLSQAVGIEWDRNNDPNVVGYRVYYGEGTRSYAAVIDADNETTVNLPPLEPGKTYYFAVTAYDIDLFESDFSEEISYSEPQVNDPPIAVPDMYQTVRNVPLTVSSVDGVLDNDFDPEEDPFDALLVTSPTHGTLSLDSSGSFSYVPFTDFAGIDTFAYRCTDGNGVSDAVIVTIMVAANPPPPNRAPVAQPNSYPTSQNTTLNVTSYAGVLNNDYDADGDLLTALLVSTTSHGSLSMNGSGFFIYTPATDFAGTDWFTYRCTDGQATSDAVTVTITVTGGGTPPPPNNVPVAQPDNYQTSQNTLLNVSSVLENDFDVDGDSLTVLLVDTTAYGSLSLETNGDFAYGPVPDFVGTDTFTYCITDGKATSAVTTVTITILAGPPAPNTAPVAQSDSYQTSANIALAITSAGGVLKNDLDADGDSLKALLVSTTSHGYLQLAGNGSFVYSPVAGFAGTDSFTYRCTDGKTNSAVVGVTITVTGIVTPPPINNPPVVQPDNYQTVQNTPLNVSSVLENDYDLDGDSVTVFLVDSTTHGTVTLNSNGDFAYLPATDFVGTDTFTYRATDGKATSTVVTVTITVIGSDSSTCPQCLVELNQILTARGSSLNSYLQRLTVPENATCLEAELLQFYTVAKTLGRLNDSQINAAIDAASICLKANLGIELNKRNAKTRTLLPSKWATLASNRLINISNQLQQSSSLENMSSRAKRLLSVLASLDKTDRYILSGEIAPIAPANQVLWCRFSVSGHTVQQLLTLTPDGFFILQDVHGNIYRDACSYERIAYDSVKLSLLLDGSHVTTLILRFSPTRGKISGDMRGWFTVR